MRDAEEAIEQAWQLCKWEKNAVKGTGTCLKHSTWGVSKQKMNNGQRFGTDRANVWNSLVYKVRTEKY